MSYSHAAYNDIFSLPLKDNLWKHRESCDFEGVCKRRNKRLQELFREHWSDHRDLARQLSRQECNFLIKEGVVTFEDVLASELIERLIPWRQGPFALGDDYIDAEWRSDFKWERIKQAISPLEGRNVLDIGCSNGYFMFHMLESAPRFVLGIDPSERNWFQFHLFQHFLQSDILQYEMLGVEDVHLFPHMFNTVFCMGVIYHQRSPIDMLSKILTSMRRGGELILESIAISGDEPYALCVPDRYTKMHNVFYVPTVSAMVSWLKKARFVDIEIISVDKTSVEEQRQTHHSPYESLKDFLDPYDETKTVEGYPAPLRACVKAKKRG